MLLVVVLRDFLQCDGQHVLPLVLSLWEHLGQEEEGIDLFLWKRLLSLKQVDIHLDAHELCFNGG
ncbi:hypothetical protein D3C85_1661230 [compost metagenome]